MRLVDITCALVIGCGLSAPAIAAEVHETAPDLSRQQRLTIVSTVLGESRPVDIYLPRGYARGSDKHPVVYVLDGEESFHYAAGVLDALYQRGLPQMILVSIPNTQRSRDLTPEAWGESSDGGGAQAFANFLADELIPAIDARYRTHAYCVLVGHSFGGLFATHVLATRRAAFQAYVAISPSMDFADHRPLATLAGSFAQPSASSVPLFVAMGAEPGGEGDSVHRLYSLLAAHGPNWLDWEFRHYPDEDHSTVPVVGAMAGLRHVFRSFVLEGRDMPGTVAEVRAHYADVSRRFGWRVTAPQRVLVNLGYRQLELGETEAALDTFRYFTEAYPTMIIGWEGLAEANVRR